MNESPVNIFGLLLYSGFDEEQGRGCLPFRQPSPYVIVQMRDVREYIVSDFPFTFSGYPVCPAMATPSAKGSAIIVDTSG